MTQSRSLMPEEIDPLQNPPDDDRNKIIVTARARIDDLYRNLLINPQFKYQCSEGNRIERHATGWHTQVLLSSCRVAQICHL